MCLAALALNVHPDFPFICVANRDEFHSRPTAPLDSLSIGPVIVLAGKDLQQGGTWLGLGQNAEFALLTNVRNSLLNKPATAPSRGELVINSILNRRGPTPDEAMQYSGFNLIHGNLLDLNLQCTSNQGPVLNNGLPFSMPLKSGIHSLSNGYLGAAWPKANLLKTNLEQAIHHAMVQKQTRDDMQALLFTLLSHTGLADDSELPSTGVPYEWEKMLSAVKIVSPHYGTRSSAVLMLDKQQQAYFCEATLDPAGLETGRRCFQVSLGLTQTACSEKQASASGNQTS